MTVDALSLMKDIADRQHEVLKKLQDGHTEQGEAIAALKVQVRLQWGITTAELLMIVGMFARHIFPTLGG